MIGVALSRGGKDFTERDRRVLDLTRPHLIQAYRNAEVRERLTGIVEGLRHGLEAEGTPVIVLDDDGAVGFASASARALVGDFAAHRSRRVGFCRRRSTRGWRGASRRRPSRLA